jgi:hypothetical protein
VLCVITILASADLRLLNIYMVCGCMCIASICVCAWCSCQWKKVHKQIFHLQEHQAHTQIDDTHAATYHVNIQRTQISGRQYSNGTKHGIWSPEDGRIKRTETCRGLVVFTNMF